MITTVATARRGLDADQLGHLRHIDAMSRLQDNDWSGMQGIGASQDDFGGYRFQLAYAAYALGLAHRHRLPNAPGVFAPTFRRLVGKILLPEVWMYWRDISRGGSVFNMHLTDSYTEQWDPVGRDNIMYSAYVQSMTLMYDVLFDDHRYAEQGSLTFDHWSCFWGGEPKTFAYDQNTLNDVIYWQMVRNGYIGVACEPNCVFQICNQPAIIGFRMHDLLTGGSRADEVVAGYQQAWTDLGRLDNAGHYAMMVSEDSREVRPNAGPFPWVDAWCGALMNTWNRDFVHEHHPRQIEALVRRATDGTVSVPLAPPRDMMGRRVVADTCDYGWVTAWASEMGDTETLQGLLAHADRYMSPTWHDGALSYPRNDTGTDADGHRTAIEPMTGNVLLGYSRLNLPDGLWGLYNEPFSPSHFAEPLLTDVADDVDVTRAWFDPNGGHLHLTVTRTGRSGDGVLGVRNAGKGPQVLVSGHELSTRSDHDLLSFVCPDDGPHDIVLVLGGAA